MTAALQPIAVTQPSAGADWTYTVPANSAFKIIAVRAQLVTSASVASRIPQLSVDDGTSGFITPAANSNAQTASLTMIYQFVAGLYNQKITVTAANSAVVAAELPNGLLLPPAARIVMTTAAISGADQWSAIKIWGVVFDHQSAYGMF